MIPKSEPSGYILQIICYVTEWKRVKVKRRQLSAMQRARMKKSRGVELCVAWGTGLCFPLDRSPLYWVFHTLLSSLTTSS